MYDFIRKKINFLISEKIEENVISNATSKSSDKEMSKDLAFNIEVIKNNLGGSSDVVIREFTFGIKKQIKGALVFIEGMVISKIINEDIMKPLMYESRLFADEESGFVNNIDTVKQALIAVGNVSQSSSFDTLTDECLSGNTVFMVNGINEALIITSHGWEKRNVEEPKTEAVVRGAREGFTESLKTSITLLRRKIKNQDIIFEKMVIGKRTKTNVCIVYIKGIVNTKLIEEIKYRLSRIKTDSILESGYIEQYIEDAPFSIFPTIGNSEKPDNVAAKLLEGRVAIIVDGTPFVLTVPLVFIENFQCSEDYYSRPYFSSIVRVIRFISYIISVLAPATYVVLSSFHQELIPTPLIYSMAAAHEGVPFPSVIEAGIMIITFEILREAGVRLPRPVGQAVSIVGALVIGEAAVSAGLIGAPMVIVVAITAVSSFVIPAQTDTGSVLRLIFLILAGFMGGFGILIGLIGLMVHLCSLRSFGTPYLSPISPLVPEGLKDTFVRVPIWGMLQRPRAIVWQDSQRQQTDLKPHPAKEKK